MSSPFAQGIRSAAVGSADDGRRMVTEHSSVWNTRDGLLKTRAHPRPTRFCFPLAKSITLDLRRAFAVRHPRAQYYDEDFNYSSTSVWNEGLQFIFCVQVNIPKTRRTYCKSKECHKHQQHKVTQYKAGKVRNQIGKNTKPKRNP